MKTYCISLSAQADYEITAASREEAIAQAEQWFYELIPEMEIEECEIE